MAQSPTTPPTAVDRFWDRFVVRARKKGVKEPAIRWHLRRAEEYLKAFAGKRLAEHSAQDVTGYLEGVGRIGRIEDWQFAQVVDAVENLLRTAGAPVARELDWAYWRDSARSLAPDDHPTSTGRGSAAARTSRREASLPTPAR